MQQRHESLMADTLFIVARVSRPWAHAEAVSAYSASLRMRSRPAAENSASAGRLSLRSEAVAAFEYAVSLQPRRSESYSLLARSHEEGLAT